MSSSTSSEARELRTGLAGDSDAGTGKSTARGTPDLGAGRVPPTAARILIPLWGETYLHRFVELSLPTLLSPGNIPAIASQLPCEVQFLTSSADAKCLRSAAAIRRLEGICRVSIQTIDDLIVSGLHSVTITLAFTRSIQAMGAAALDTCFFLLVSDYLVADGSLGHVLSLMMAGKSAVQAGNFRMIEADWPSVATAGGGNDVMCLAPRELARMALAHLHPKTIANIVDFSLCSNDDCNHLFWRAGPDTLIGRFFLLHPICVRPERTDFTVSSFVDYSFVPEMSAPENVAVVTDSDNYFVVELQPPEHESGTISLGPKSPRALAAHLSEWTTAQHRRNAEYTIVYHAGELPRDLSRVMATADAFLSMVRQYLSPHPQPHRSHPYWTGAVTSYQVRAGRLPDELADNVVQHSLSRMGAAGKRVTLRQWLRRTLLGQFPDVGIADPRWPDLLRLTGVLAAACNRGSRTVLTAGAPREFNAWLARHCRCQWLVGAAEVTDQTGMVSPLTEANLVADDCLLYLNGRITDQLRLAMRVLVGALRPGGRLFILAINGGSRPPDKLLKDLRLEFMSDLERLAGHIEEVRFTPSSRLRASVAWAMRPAGGDVLARAKRARHFARIRMVGLVFLSVVVNLLAVRRAGNAPRDESVSSVFIVATPANRLEGAQDPSHQIHEQ